MKILNFGSMGIDYVFTVEHFVRPGETLSTGSREIYCGGKGLNQSIALARAGASVCQAGAVGASDGEFLLDSLRENGVDVSRVKKLSHIGSQNALIQVNPQGQNCILLYGGADLALTENMLEEVFAGFEAGDYLVLQNEVNLVDRMIALGHEKGMKVILNPSPLNAAIGEMPLEDVDLFILNEVEGEGLCGVADKEKMIWALQEKFPEAAIMLTLGSDGSVYLDPSCKEPIRQPAFSVQAVDTTAAGDTFTGYLVAGLAAGLTVEEAMERASAAAAISVTRNGASPSIPTAKETEAFLKERGRQKEFELSPTWAQDGKQELLDFIEEQGVYIRE